MLVERVADTTDLDFIYSCLLFGARKGHYSFNAENPAVVKDMKKEIQSVVCDGLLTDNRFAIASIFLIENKRIGTVILCEAAPGESNFEIYALSVAQRYQHQRFGSRILDSVLERLCYVDVYARCSPASRTMQKMLIHRSFKPYMTDNGFNTMVRKVVDRNDLASPMCPVY